MRPSGCSGIVLAGGGNSRFDGVLKGFLPLGEGRIVDRVLAAIAAVADEVIVIANDPAIRRGLPALSVHSDARSERGSLIGLYSGLAHAREGALVVAWDMPFVSSALLRALRRLGEARGAAVVPEGLRGPEPLCAYYPRSMLEIIERQIGSGDLRLGALLDVLPDRIVIPLERVAELGHPERLFKNVNTVADLETARRWLDDARSTDRNHLSHSGSRP